MIDCVYIDQNFSKDKKESFINYLNRLNFKYVIIDEICSSVTFIITKKSRMIIYKKYKCSKFTPIAIKEISEMNLGISELIQEKRKIYNLFLKDKCLYLDSSVDNIERVQKQIKRCCGQLASDLNDKVDFVICAGNEDQKPISKSKSCLVVRQNWLEELETSSFYVKPDNYVIKSEEKHVDSLKRSTKTQAKPKINISSKRSRVSGKLTLQIRSQPKQKVKTGEQSTKRKKDKVLDDFGLRQLKIKDFSTQSSQKSQDISSQSSQGSQAIKKTSSQKIQSQKTITKEHSLSQSKMKNSSSFSQSSSSLNMSQNSRNIDILSYFNKGCENYENYENIQRLCQEIMDDNECNVPLSQNFNNVQQIYLHELNEFSQRDVKEYQDIVEYPHGNEIDIQNDE